MDRAAVLVMLILLNQPLKGLMKDDQRVSLHMHVCATPCRPAGASELWAGFAQHNLPVAFHSHSIHSLTDEKKNSNSILSSAQTINTEGDIWTIKNVKIKSENSQRSIAVMSNYQDKDVAKFSHISNYPNGQAEWSMLPSC